MVEEVSVPTSLETIVVEISLQDRITGSRPLVIETNWEISLLGVLALLIAKYIVGSTTPTNALFSLMLVIVISAQLAQIFSASCNGSHPVPDWYVDLGALAHMTSQTSAVKPYSGNGSVW